MAVVAPSNFRMRSRWVKPRARRTALLAASVPEDVSRTFSTEGTASTISSARRPRLRWERRTSSRRRRLLDGLDDLGIGVPEDERAPRHHPVDVPAPVRVLEVGALGAGDEEGLLAAHRAPRAHGRVDAARDDRPRAAPERGGYNHCAASLGPVGDDDVRAGALDRRQALERRLALVQPAARGRRLHHRVLAAHVVGEDREVEARPRPR